MGALRRGLAVAVALLAGCTPASPWDDVLPESPGREVRGCMRLDPHQRDWCVLQFLKASVTGGSWRPSALDTTRACDLMAARAAADQCYEWAMRELGEPLPPAETCERIQDGRMRWSCRLALVDRRLDEVDAEEAARGCLRTGPLLRHCLTHIGQAWEQRWLAGGMDGMSRDVAVIVALVGEGQGTRGFAEVVGRVVAKYPGPAPAVTPCDVFLFEPSRLACRRVSAAAVP